MSEPQKPRTERARQREETRRRLFDAAVEIIRRDGLDAARIDEIASAAGVSRGTFYFHYPTKEDVLVELLDDSQRAVSDELEALPADAPLALVLDTTASAIARQWQDDPGMLRAIGTVALKLTARSLPDAVEQHAVHQALMPRFQAAYDRGEVGDLIPPQLMTEFFLVNVFGAALAWCGNPIMPLEGVLRNVVAFFVRAATD